MNSDPVVGKVQDEIDAESVWDDRIEAFALDLTNPIGLGRYDLVDAAVRSQDVFPKYQFHFWISKHCNDPDLVKDLIEHKDLKEIAYYAAREYVTFLSENMR